MQCIKSTCVCANGCAGKHSESPSRAERGRCFSSPAETCLISSKARRVARRGLNTLNHCVSSRGYSQLMSTPCVCASQNAAMARASFRRVASERVAAAKCFERPAPPSVFEFVPCPSHASRARRIVSASGNRSSAPSAPSLVGSSENKSTCVTRTSRSSPPRSRDTRAGMLHNSLKVAVATLPPTSEVVPRLASAPSRDQPMRSDARRMKSAKHARALLGVRAAAARSCAPKSAVERGFRDG